MLHMMITSIIFTSTTEVFLRSIKRLSTLECFTLSSIFLTDNLMSTEHQLRETGRMPLEENISMTAILDQLQMLLLWASLEVALDNSWSRSLLCGLSSHQQPLHTFTETRSSTCFTTKNTLIWPMLVNNTKWAMLETLF